MKHARLHFGVLVASLAVGRLAFAQPPQLPDPLYAQGFEHGLDTWMNGGNGGKASVETSPENVKEGASSLRFDYQVAPGSLNIAVVPFATRSLATLQSIKFWIKANHSTTFAFLMQEQGGGRFSTVFPVVKDQWQHVEISPADLVLGTNRDDPQDANGTLDLDKIEGMALLDFDQILAPLAATPANPFIALLGLETGSRTLYLDDVVLSSQPLAAAPVGPAQLDSFNRPQAEWISVGNVTLKTVPLVAGQPDKDQALQATYTQEAKRLSAFSKLLAPGVLAGKTKLSFDISSRQRATLIVQVEERSGGKYNALLSISGDAAPDAQPTTQITSFSEFRPADDSKDNNDRLDLDQVKQLLFIDASGLLGLGTGDNTLRLSHLRAQ